MVRVVRSATFHRWLRKLKHRRAAARVLVRKALGSEIMVHFNIDARTVDSGDPDSVEETGASANAVGRFNPRSRARMRESITIAVVTENMHFFDPRTRASIWS